MTRQNRSARFTTFFTFCRRLFAWLRLPSRRRPGGAPRVSRRLTFETVEARILLSANSADFNGDTIVDAADLAIWQDNYGSTSGIVHSLGDADADGDVDGADFLSWQRGDGQTIPTIDITFTNADFNGDNTIDANDLTSWSQGYGTSTGAEPSQGDADGDGDVDGSDFLAWQRGDIGTLTIDDTQSGINQIVVSTVDVTGVNVVAVNGNTTTIPTDQVEAIIARGGGGDDEIDLSLVDATSFPNLVSGEITIRAGAGNDTVFGTALDDKIFGGPGDDTFSFSGTNSFGTDSLFELVGEGTDTLDFSGLDQPIQIDLANTALAEVVAGNRLWLAPLAGVEIENVIGTDLADTILGNDLDNWLLGRDGNDQLRGREGEDILVGGDGDDQLFGDAGRDGLFGEAGNDLLFGGAGDDQLAGWEGDDTSYGGTGNDVLIASPGIDNLYGGPGDDLYVFPRRDEQALDDDTIYENPSEGEDSIYLPPETSTVTINAGSAAPQTIGPNSRLTLSGGGANFENFWTEEAPAEPDQFNVTGTNATQIDLTWQPTTDLSGYQIERLTESGADWQIVFEVPLGTNNVSTYSDTDVTDGVTYNYRITRETLQGGLSEYSYQIATAATAVSTVLAASTASEESYDEIIDELKIIHPSNVELVSGDLAFVFSKQGTGQPSVADGLMGDSIIDAGVGHFNGPLPVVNYDFEPGTLVNGPGDDFVFVAYSSTAGGFTISAPGFGQISAAASTNLNQPSNSYFLNSDNPIDIIWDTLYTAYDLSDLGVPEGDSVDRLVLNSPSSGDWAGIGAIQQSVLEIVVQTFIPLQKDDDGNATIPTVGYNPFGWFATDPRDGIDATPGVADNDYRTRLQVLIDTTNSKAISMTSDAGPTVQYENENATGFVEMAEAQEGGQMVHRVKSRPFQDKTLISLRGEATNPLVTVYNQCPRLNPCGGYLEQLGDLVLTPFAIFNPSIDFDFQMTFDSESKELQVLGHSNFDGFPSNEIFARYNGGPWEEVFFHDSNAENQNPFSLFGSGEFTVGEIDPTDLSP